MGAPCPYPPGPSLDDPPVAVYVRMHTCVVFLFNDVNEIRLLADLGLLEHAMVAVMAAPDDPYFAELEAATGGVVKFSDSAFHSLVASGVRLITVFRSNRKLADMDRIFSDTAGTTCVCAVTRNIVGAAYLRAIHTVV